MILVFISWWILRIAGRMTRYGNTSLELVDLVWPVKVALSEQYSLISRGRNYKWKCCDLAYNLIKRFVWFLNNFLSTSTICCNLLQKNGHNEDILSIAYCPPNLLATSSYDGEVIIWNMVSGHIFCHLWSPPDPNYVSDSCKYLTVYRIV